MSDTVPDEANPDQDSAAADGLDLLAEAERLERRWHQARTYREAVTANYTDALQRALTDELAAGRLYREAIALYDAWSKGPLT